MRFKILVFVLALAFLAGTFLAAYWFYDTIDRPERRAEMELGNRVRRAAQDPPPDPAAPLFQKAIDALTAGNIDVAHEHLTRLMKVYPSSPRVAETRRMLGEINFDRLFSRSPMPGKRDYIVKPGDSLARIEKGSLTTIPFLKQLNNLSGLNLQPGDRLVYQPLEFELEVRLADSTLTVRQRAAAGLDPAFFKDYRITAAVLPPHFRQIPENRNPGKSGLVGRQEAPRHRCEICLCPQTSAVGQPTGTRGTDAATGIGPTGRGAGSDGRPG